MSMFWRRNGSVLEISSACPKYPSSLLDLWSQLVQCPYHQQSRSCSSLQMSSRCHRCIKIHSWKKEDFRRVPRWKIGHGGECKAENWLRHSSLSVSEWLVNSLVWRSKFQFSTNSRWRKEGREWKKSPQKGHVTDVRSSHQGCRGSPCPPTPESRSSPGIQQRKKQ